MEREVNTQLKQIQQSIKQSLIKNNISPSPDMILEYTYKTIMKLEKNDIIPKLYSVIFIYKDFIKYNKSLHELILFHINSEYESKVHRLLKIFINNEKSHKHLFKDLFDNYKKTNNQKLKSILELFGNKEDILNDLNDEEERLRFINLFFKDLIGKINFYELIKMVYDIEYELLNKFVDYTLTVNTNSGICFDIISLSTPSVQKDKNKYALSQEDIKSNLLFVINKLISNKHIHNKENKILEIINKIMFYNNLNYLKTKETIIDFSKDFKDFIKTIILSENTKIQKIQEFLSVNKLFLIPHFISLIKEIKDEKILQYLVTLLDINVLDELLDLDANILRYSTNNDISTFFKYYTKDPKFINIVPTFLNYCTDNYNLIGQFTDFIFENIKNNYFTICTCLKNIIISHELNLNKEVYLTNLISKETSQRILKAIVTYDMFKLVLSHYQPSPIVKELLFMIIERINIKNIPIDTSNEECLLDSKFKFYIPKIDININLISKVLEGCNQNDPSQKKYYEILYYLKKYNKLSMCICNEVYSKEMLDNLHACSSKYRIMALSFKCIEKECNREELFFKELVTYMYTGNKNAKVICSELLEDLLIKENNKIIRYILENIKNNDINVRCGSLLSYEVILRTNTSKLEYENMRDIYEHLLSIYKKINALVIIKVLIGYVLYTRDIVENDIVEVIEYFMENKSNKYRKDIKQLIGAIIGRNAIIKRENSENNEITLSRKIKQYYKYKIKTEMEEIIIKK